MQTWIQIDGDINGKYKPLMVSRPEEATALSNGDAQQVTRAASDEHRDFLWQSVKVGSHYVVAGSPKK